MPNLTIRDIPIEVMEKIRILSKTERRSLNNEMLMILENGLKHYIEENATGKCATVSKETQIEIWRQLSGHWEDVRRTEDVIDDIYSNRTKGRDIEL